MEYKLYSNIILYNKENYCNSIFLIGYFEDIDSIHGINMSFEEFLNYCLCYSGGDDIRQQLFRFHGDAGNCSWLVFIFQRLLEIQYHQL